MVKSRCYICYICRFGVTKAEPAEDDTVLQGFRISLVLRPLPNHDLGQSRFRFGGKTISNDHEITRSARSFVKETYILLGETHSDPFLDTSLLSRVSVDQRLKKSDFQALLIDRLTGRGMLQTKCSRLLYVAATTQPDGKL